MKLLAALAILALAAVWRHHQRRVRAWAEWDDTDWTLGDPRLVDVRGNGVRAG